MAVTRLQELARDEYSASTTTTQAVDAARAVEGRDARWTSLPMPKSTIEKLWRELNGSDTIFDRESTERLAGRAPHTAAGIGAARAPDLPGTFMNLRHLARPSPESLKQMFVEIKKHTISYGDGVALFSMAHPGSAAGRTYPGWPGNDDPGEVERVGHLLALVTGDAAYECGEEEGTDEFLDRIGTRLQGILDKRAAAREAPAREPRERDVAAGDRWRR